jgi:hypothetical protein
MAAVGADHCVALQRTAGESAAMPIRNKANRDNAKRKAKWLIRRHRDDDRACDRPCCRLCYVAALLVPPR